MKRTTRNCRLPTLPRHKVLRTAESRETKAYFKGSPGDYNFCCHHLSKGLHPEYGEPVIIAWPGGVWAASYSHLLTTKPMLLSQYIKAQAFLSFRGPAI